MMTRDGHRLAGTGPLERREENGKACYYRNGELVAVRVLTAGGREVNPIELLEERTIANVTYVDRSA